MRSASRYGGVLALLCVQFLNADGYIAQSVKDEYRQQLNLYAIKAHFGGLKDRVSSESLRKFPFVDAEIKGVSPTNYERFKDMASESMSKPLELEDLPCKSEMIEKKAKLPPITFVEEIHICPNCQIENALRILDARDGKYVYAAEGFDYEKDTKELSPIEEAESPYFSKLLSSLPPSDKKVFGLEDFGQSYARVVGLIADAQDPSEAKQEKILPPLDFDPNKQSSDWSEARYTRTIEAFNFLMWSESSAFHINSINEIAKTDPDFKRNFADPLSKFRDRIFQIVNDKKELNVLEEYKAFLGTFSYDVVGMNFAKLMQYQFQAFSETDTPKEAAARPEKSKFLKQKNWDFEDWRMMEELLTIPARNKEFAASILKIYCEEALPKGLPLVVKMGVAHSHGTKFAIENTLKHLSAPDIIINFEADALKFLEMLETGGRDEHLEQGFERIEERLRSAHSENAASSKEPASTAIKPVN